MYSRNNYNKLVTGIIASNRNIAASYAREQEKKKHFDPNKKNHDKMKFSGREWCFQGFDLEDAPEELRNNPSFIEGYQTAMSLNIQSYDEGFKWFMNEKNREFQKLLQKIIKTIYIGCKDTMMLSVNVY